MRATDLKHRVTIQQPGTRTRLPSGGYTEGAPTNVATTWASIEPLRGNERIRAMQTEASVTHRVRMRYRPGITAAMRVIHESRTFQIVGPPIDPGERHTMLELMVREVTA